MSEFPFFENAVETTEKIMPLYKDIAWDYENNKPIVIDGVFKLVTGVEAIKGWIYRIIQTERYKHEIYSWNYGSEISTIVGKTYNALNKSESERIVKECIRMNPYVTDVTIIESIFSDNKITMKFEVDTIYGKTQGVLNV